MPALIALAVDEFRKALPEMSIGSLTLLDYWIGWDSVVCTYIPPCATLGGSGTKLRCLLTFWKLSVFYFHVDNSAENVMMAKV
jgi:hypothetical protein